MMLPFAITIPIYSDPGHAWGAVKRSLLQTLEARGMLKLSDISGYSYQRGGTVYLEEDRDLSLVCEALRRDGFVVTTVEKGNGGTSWVRSLPAFSPTLAPLPGGLWLAFRRGAFGPILISRGGELVQAGSSLTHMDMHSQTWARELAKAHEGYAPIRASSKRAHDLCLARGYTYSQPLRQPRG